MYTHEAHKAKRGKAADPYENDIQILLLFHYGNDTGHDMTSIVDIW